MNTASSHIDHSAPYAREVREGNWFTRAEAWLDERGKCAWIAATVIGFIVAWPVGLGLLAYMIWSKRMFSGKRATRGHSRSPYRAHFKAAMKSSGNAAFDSYKTETLRRLEDEQDDFEAFLQRLREAKDKAEFDEFMAARAKEASSEDHGQDDDAPRPA